MLKVAYDNTDLLRGEIAELTDFIKKRFSIPVKRKHITLLLAKSCGWTKYKELENVSRSGKSVGFSSSVTMYSELTLEEKQTVFLKRVVLMYDLLVRFKVSKENAGLCSYDYIRSNISFKEKLVMKLSNLKEYKISMMHPATSLREHSVCLSSLIKGIRSHLKIYELLYTSGSPSVWVTRTGSFDVVREYMEDVSDLPVKEQVIQNKMLNSGEINYHLFVSNFELMLSSLTDIKPEDYRSAYLVRLLSELFQDECATIKDIDGVKKVFNIDNMIEKLHDKDMGIFIGNLGRKFTIT